MAAAPTSYVFTFCGFLFQRVCACAYVYVRARMRVCVCVFVIGWTLLFGEKKERRVGKRVGKKREEKLEKRLT